MGASFSKILEKLSTEDVDIIQSGAEQLIASRKVKKLTPQQRRDVTVSLQKALSYLSKVADGAALLESSNLDYQSKIKGIQGSIFYVAGKLSLSSTEIAYFAFEENFILTPDAVEFLTNYTFKYPDLMRRFLYVKKEEIKIVAAAYLLSSLVGTVDKSEIKQTLSLGKLQGKIYEATMLNNSNFLIAWIQFANIAGTSGSMVNHQLLSYLESVDASNFENNFCRTFFYVVSRTGAGDINTINRLNIIYSKVALKVSKGFALKLLAAKKYAAGKDEVPIENTKNDSLPERIIRQLQSSKTRVAIGEELAHPEKKLIRDLAQQIKESNIKERKKFIETIVKYASAETARHLLELLVETGGQEMKAELIGYQGCPGLFNKKP